MPLLVLALIALLISFGVMTFRGKVALVIKVFGFLFFFFFFSPLWVFSWRDNPHIGLNNFTSLFSLTRSRFHQRLRAYRSAPYKHSIDRLFTETVCGPFGWETGKTKYQPYKAI